MRTLGAALADVGLLIYAISVLAYCASILCFSLKELDIIARGRFLSYAQAGRPRANAFLGAHRRLEARGPKSGLRSAKGAWVASLGCCPLAQCLVSVRRGSNCGFLSGADSLIWAA